MWQLCSGEGVGGKECAFRQVSKREAKRIREMDEKRVLAEKKLVLVLDIDHTLLNSGRFNELSHDENRKLAKIKNDVRRHTAHPPAASPC